MTSTSAPTLRRYSLQLLWGHLATVIATLVVSVGFILAELACLGILLLLVQGGFETTSDITPSLAQRLLPGLTVSQRVATIGTVLLGAFLLRGLCQSLFVFLPRKVEQEILVELRQKSFRKFLAMDFQALHRDGVGRTYGYLHNYPVQCATSAAGLLGVLLGVGQLATLALGLLVVSPILTISCTLLLGGGFLLSKRILTPHLHRLSEQHLSAENSLSSLCLETINGIRTVRLFCKAGNISKRHAAESTICRKHHLAHVAASSTLQPVILTIIGVGVSSILIGGALLSGDAVAHYLPTLTLFILMLTRVSGPFHQITCSHSLYVKGHAAAKALSEFMEREIEADGIVGSSLPPFSHALSFEHVSFHYEGSDKGALHDISLQIPSGKVTAIVGPSGAGKSTLINLIGRLLTPTSGNILVDGTSLQELPLDAWRKKLAFVSQEVCVFNDTIANNLRFAREDASEAELIEAAKIAQADEFIREQQDGYQTVIGHNGVRLSGGQKQRLAIARALLGHPEILILDEATSHLDSLSERAFQKAIEKLRESCTVIVIAHRLSTVTSADQIVVMRDGRICEVGTHKTLTSQDGLYQQLVAAQVSLSD